MLKSVRQQQKKSPITKRRYGSEQDVFALTGIMPRTLQKHRLFGKGFTFYRVGTRILYDLNEVEETIRAGRVGAA